MKKKSKKRDPRAAEIAAWLKKKRSNRSDVLGKNQQELAANLGVDRGTVIAWEGADRAPSAENLIAIGNRVGYPDAKQAWIYAGVDPRLLQAWEEDLPAGSRRVTLGLFPFMPGDIIAISSADADDLWTLRNELVAFDFTKYPAELQVTLSTIQVQRLHARALANQPELERADRTFELMRKSRQSRGLGPADNSEEVSQRWTPDENGDINFECTQAGWLRLQIANDPEFSQIDDPDYWLSDRGPWRFVLQGASVRDVLVPLMPWNSGPKGRKNFDLEGKRLLGRVVGWKRAEALPLAKNRVVTPG
jgi:transcriptional regulator with XRE-family HTH domain